jgi:hypothetical protein
LKGWEDYDGDEDVSSYYYLKKTRYLKLKEKTPDPLSGELVLEETMDVS